MILLFTMQSVRSQTDTIQQFKIGDHHGGGIIFYLDETGQHGLIAAKWDQATKARWTIEDGVTNAKYLNDGLANTKIIIKSNRKSDFDPKKTAAFICDNLSLEEYSDWYLPAFQELKKMHVSQENIGNFLAGYYWSSTEYNRKKAWTIAFGPSKKVEKPNSKYYKRLNVRCIRKF